MSAQAVSTSEGDATPKTEPLPPETATARAPPSPPAQPTMSAPPSQPEVRQPSPTSSRSSSKSGGSSESKSGRGHKSTVSGVGQGNHSTLGGSSHISRPPPPRNASRRAVSYGSPVQKSPGSAVRKLSGPLSKERRDSANGENDKSSPDTHLTQDGEPFTPYEGMGEHFFDKYWSTYDPNRLGKIRAKDMFRFFEDIQTQTPGLVDGCLFSKSQSDTVFEWMKENMTRTLTKEEFKEMYAQATGLDLCAQIYRISSKAPQGREAKADNATTESREEVQYRKERFMDFMNRERSITPEMPSTLPELQGTPHFGDRPPVRNLLSDFSMTAEPFTSPTRLDLHESFPPFSPAMNSTSLLPPDLDLETQREQQIAELKEEQAKLMEENERLQQQLEATTRDQEAYSDAYARDRQSDGTMIQTLQEQLAEKETKNDALTKEVRNLRKERDLHLKQLEHSEADREAATAKMDAVQKSLERDLNELRKAREQENSRKTQIRAEVDGLKRQTDSLQSQVKHFRELYEKAKVDELKEKMRVKELEEERNTALATIKAQELHIIDQEKGIESILDSMREMSKRRKKFITPPSNVPLAHELKEALPEEDEFSWFDKEIEKLQTESEKRLKARRQLNTPRNVRFPMDFVGEVEYIQKHVTMNFVGECVQTDLTIDPFYKDTEPALSDFVQDPMMASFHTLRNSGTLPDDVVPDINDASTASAGIQTSTPTHPEIAIQTSPPTSPQRPHRQPQNPPDTYTETITTTRTLYNRLTSLATASKPLTPEDITTIHTFIKAQDGASLLSTAFSLPALILSSQRREPPPNTRSRPNPNRKPGALPQAASRWSLMATFLFVAIAALALYNAVLYYSLRSDENRWLQANGDVWGGSVAGCYRVCPGDGSGWRWKAMVWEVLEEWGGGV